MGCLGLGATTLAVSEHLFRLPLAALQGFLADSTVVVAADILVLDEAVSFSREADLAAGAAAHAGVGTLALSSNGGSGGLAGAGDVLR